MKKKITFFLIALIGLTGCPPGGPKPQISPPIVEPTLLACASIVTIKGFIPGAKIDIYANGTTHIGGGISDSPWGQVFSVSPALISGNFITATQTFDGVTSDPSQKLQVQSAREVFKGNLPKPLLDKPIYKCGGAISVRNLAKGGLLKVYANGVEIGNVNGCGDGQWLNVSPVFDLGQSITADVKLCSQVSPLSDPVIVDPTPTSLPQLSIGDIYENGTFCTISNITNGARVKTYNNGTLIDDHSYPGGGQIVRLTPQVVPGDAITATQELCGVISIPSHPSIVKPCSELPAPMLAPICPGATTVTITGGVLGARIRVYRDGVLAADGGGDEVLLFAPAKHGENYWATQSLGNCVSPESVALAVGCDEPGIIKINIPYMGRAVAVAVDPSDDNRIVVASETGGLFRSTDKGNNWTHISGTTNFVYTDVTYLKYEKDVIIATATVDTRKISGGGIWRSTDNGTTWKQADLKTPDPNCVKGISGYCLSVCLDNKRIWAGTSCGLAFSDNSGMDWKFQSVVPGYNNDAVFSIVTPDKNRIAMVTMAGVMASKDGGLNFDTAMNGIPVRWSFSAVHNQLAVAPNDADHLFWAIYHIPDGDSLLYRGVFWSVDFGDNWKTGYDEKSMIGSKNGGNRPLFTRTAPNIDKKPNKYDVYWGSGFNTFKRATASTGTSMTIGAWTDMSTDHSDPSDVGFENANGIPLLHLSDGGLHKTKDKGKTWKLAGGGPYGYNALQITEVTGQLHQEDHSADLYFATQDNSLWASPDLGASWIRNRCCEGFFLNIMRDYYPPDKTRFTGVACGACGNFISKPLLDGQADWSNPPKDKGNPRLLKPAFYIQNSYPFDSAGSLFQLTKNTGTHWDSAYKFLQDSRDLSKVSGDLNDPVIFTAFRAPGNTPDGHEMVNIKKITGLLSGGPIVSDISGFGSLGVFPTMFAWYSPFGVDPSDPDFIIVGDIVHDSIKVTTDGGITWSNDSQLTKLITGNGEFYFRQGSFTQLSCIGFDPDCRNHILVGTKQAGIFTTYNRGATWGRIPGTENIPFVSSFFFAGNGVVIVSSYGRGLWKLKDACDERQKKNQARSLHLAGPFIWQSKAKIALSSIKDPALMPRLVYVLVKGGDITGYTVNRETRMLEEVTISSGELVAYTWDGRVVQVPFKVTTGKGQGSYAGDEEVAGMVREKMKVKGVLVEGKAFKAPVLSDKDITPDQLPKQGAPSPYIFILNQRAGIAVVEGNEAIRISGKNFNPNGKLEILLDGARVKLRTEPKVDKSGSFMLNIPQMLALGGHTITVKQQVGTELLQDVTTFVKRVRDDR